MPPEYEEYVLCEKFKCLPSELEKQDAYKMDIFLKIINLEAESQERRYKKLNGR